MGITAHLNTMGVMNEAIEDAVGCGGIANLFVPNLPRDGDAL